MSSVSVAAALHKSRNLFKSKKELRAMEEEKRGQELLDQKFFAFQDLVQDNRIAEAVAFYEDPLRRDDAYNNDHAQDGDGENEKGLEDYNDDRYDEPDNAREDCEEARPQDDTFNQGKAIVLQDSQLEKRVKTAYEYNTLLSKLDINTVKVQAYILTAVSLNLGQNVLHLACELGNLQLCSFIIDKAGPKELNILPLIINIIDKKERSPLYLLCLRGYVHNHDPYLQLKVGLRKKMIEKLIPPVAKTQYNKNTNTTTHKGPLASNLKHNEIAHWYFVSEEINYTAFHWLAYWNDTESLYYLLNQVPESQENYLKILVENERGDTPLGLAAAHGSHESAIMIIEHLVKDFNVIQGVFLDRVHEMFKHSSKEKKNAITLDPSKQHLDTSDQQKWELIFVNTKHLNQDQRRFSKLFYWSAFYGLQDVVFKFLGLGVSPFMKIYNGKNAIDACIEGLQYDLLELLLKDSRQQTIIPDERAMSNGIEDDIIYEAEYEPKFQKYKILMPDHIDYYRKSRQNKDEFGNNACHFAFQISDLVMRYKILKLLITEKVGDPNKRNKMGMLPQDIEHNLQYNFIPADIKHHFKETLREHQEGDYLIITSQTQRNKGNKELILSQLKQLGLQKFTRVYTEQTEEDKNHKDKTKTTVYINIQIPDHIMNAVGSDLGIETTLSYSFTDIFVKAPYDQNYNNCFNKFDADEKYEAIEAYLGKEIDFQYYKSAKIIENCYTLHKRQTIAAIQASFERYKYKLIRNFFSSRFQKYLEPINMIKNYFGEKYAFETLFLLHYQAWLLIPTFLGILVMIRQAVAYFLTQNVNDTLDTEANGLFGLAIAVWATTFFESWKRKQGTIQYLWNCNDTSYSCQDERDESFKFNWIYNATTDQPEKRQKVQQKQKKLLLQCAQGIFLTCVIICMFLHNIISERFRDQTDPATGAIIKKATFEDKVNGYIENVIYSILIVLFELAYKRIALMVTELENYQYQTQYDDTLITRLFIFNFFNFYLPLFIAAFVKQQYQALFIMMGTQMSAKQIGKSLYNYYMPIFTTKRKLDRLNEEYKEIIEYYEDVDCNATVGGVQSNHASAKTDDNPTSNEAHKIKKEKDNSNNNSMFQSMYKSRPQVQGKEGEDDDHIEKKTIRRYQTLRDAMLGVGKGDIVDNYMQLIVQFGFIVLFGGVFPPAALLSSFTNFIQIASQMRNFSYSRRFKAEVSNGIGSFTNCLEILTKLSVITNSLILFFTSHAFQRLLVKVQASAVLRQASGLAGADITGGCPGRVIEVYEQHAGSYADLLGAARQQQSTAGLIDAAPVGQNLHTLNSSKLFADLTEFLVFVVAVEHGILMLAMFLGYAIDDKPEHVIKGERERQILLDTYKSRMDCQAKLTASKRECDSMFEATMRIFSRSKNVKKTDPQLEEEHSSLLHTFQGVASNRLKKNKLDKSGEAVSYLMPAEADTTTGAQAGYEAEYYRVKLLAHRLRKARAKGQRDFDSFATERSLANFSKLRAAVKKVMQDNITKKDQAHPVTAGNRKKSNTIVQQLKDEQLKSTLAAKAVVSAEKSPEPYEQTIELNQHLAAPGLSSFARTEAEGLLLIGELKNRQQPQPAALQTIESTIDPNAYPGLRTLDPTRDRTALPARPGADEVLLDTLLVDNNETMEAGPAAQPINQSPQNIQQTNSKSIEHQTEYVDPQLQTSVERLVVPAHFEDKPAASPSLPAIDRPGRGAQIEIISPCGVSGASGSAHGERLSPPLHPDSQADTNFKTIAQPAQPEEPKVQFYVQKITKTNDGYAQMNEEPEEHDEFK